jgi:hypothetical protein
MDAVLGDQLRRGVNGGEKNPRIARLTSDETTEKRRLRGDFPTSEDYGQLRRISTSLL